MLLADDKIWDQNGFNQRRQLGPSVNAESGLVYAFDGNLKLGILPASISCSGHTYFVQARTTCVYTRILGTLAIYLDYLLKFSLKYSMLAF